MGDRLPTRVVLVTEVDFWNGGAGHRARILALVRYLAARLQLSVVLPTPIDDLQRARCEVACPGLELTSLALPARVTMAQALLAMRSFFAARPQQACIIEYLSLGWLLQAVPAGVSTLVDTHDVASQRDADFMRAGRQPPWALTTSAQERARLALFDRVIAISAPDAAQFSQWLGAERVLLAPHAHEARPQPFREQAHNLLFVGSGYAPNRDGLAWLLSEVWPRLQTTTARLDVVGDAGQALAGHVLPPMVHLHGQVTELEAAYREADLCLNPVQYGSGLKIKTVEALAHGRALVCSPHGARGLEAWAGQAFVVADGTAQFAAAIDQLLADAARRRQLAVSALQVVCNSFNADACYGPLLKALSALTTQAG